jgi:hypothetical protein
MIEHTDITEADFKENWKEVEWKWLLIKKA